MLAGLLSDVHQLSPTFTQAGITSNPRQYWAEAQLSPLYQFSEIKILREKKGEREKSNFLYMGESRPFPQCLCGLDVIPSRVNVGESSAKTQQPCGFDVIPTALQGGAGGRKTTPPCPLHPYSSEFASTTSRLLFSIHSISGIVFSFTPLPTYQLESENSTIRFSCNYFVDA